MTTAICTGVAERVVVAAVDLAGVVGPAAAGVEAADCRVVCVCDVVTGGLRVGVVFRFVVCASDPGANANERVKTNRPTRGLIVTGRFIRAGCVKAGCSVGVGYFIRAERFKRDCNSLS